MKSNLPMMLAALTAACVSLAPAAAQEQDFFKGKTINLLVGFGPGGENDEWARMIAVHMPKHIPGNPTVVVNNAPGAGGLKLMNTLYNVSPRDGTAIGLISRGIPLEPVLGGSGIQFDPLEMSWIGSPDREITVCAARKDAQVQTMKDLFEKELTVGATGSGSDSAVYPNFLSGLLGMKFKTIKGYKGSQDIALAMQRNEVEGMFVVYDSLQLQPLWREGELNILFQATLKPDPRLNGTPIVTDFARSEEDRKVLGFFFDRVQLGRPFVAPPGLPPQRVAILRKAFDDTMKDPDLVADVQKRGLSIDAITGQELADIIADVDRAPKDVVDRTSEALDHAGKHSTK
jgi:tripartite-type tricarboxylate transporter receptor subunit TctC